MAFESAHSSYLASDNLEAGLAFDQGPRTIRELVEQLAESHSEVTCLIGPEAGTSLSFQELREETIAISSTLRRAGLEHGDKIAFLLDNGLPAAKLFLSAMYGGFVSVPLNVRAGVSQLAYILDHCDARVVFVGDEYRLLIDEAMAQVRRDIRVIPINTSPFEAETEASHVRPFNAPEPEDVALLMYTSGSTGRPKAAVHSHRALLAAAQNSIQAHQLTAADRSLLVLPLYHINAECVTLIPTLMSGGSVVVPSRFNVSEFWDLLEKFECTWSAVVPTIISQLLDWEDPRANQRKETFKRIRFLRSSSAPLAPSLHREFLRKFELLLIQAMGSSEAGNVFSNPLPPRENKIGSPGLPWGFEAKVVNQVGAELPEGEAGEVVLRGPAMMHGYYKEPEETASVLDSDGWFHTGDLAYRDEDGYFFVVGRSKELIIKGGVNIAPRQIDDVLESHPSVLEAAAVGVPDRYVGEDVIAFVVLRAGRAIQERDLLAFCEARLGPFKTPTRIHFAKDLPKGPSGKVQRLKLRDEVAKAVLSQTELGTIDTNESLSSDGLPPVSSIERIIFESWSDVLSCQNIDIDTNFFALGGHSLLAIQCVSRIRDKISVALSLSDFFENGTIARQTALVIQRLRTNNGIARVVRTERSDDLQREKSVGVSQFPVRDRSLPCPLSSAQMRVWFDLHLHPGSRQYNESEAVRLLGQLNEDALKRALQAVVSRHEGLRTTIKEANSEPIAVIHDDWTIGIKKIDLSALSPVGRQAEVDDLLIREPRRLYHLESEPGIRATLIRVTPREHVFILMVHHLFFDWASLGVFWREIAMLYRSFSRSEPCSLPPLTVQHGDYAAWKAKELIEVSYAKELAYWEESLRGAPEVLEIPTDRPRPVVTSHQGSRIRLHLDSTLTGALRELGRRSGTTLFSIFAAALNILLYRYSGQADILLGIPIADRDREELQALIGFLLQVHVLRTEVSGDATFRDILSRVQHKALELYQNRAVPFDQVVSALQPKRSSSYSPLYQMMLIWRDQGQMPSFIGLDGLKVESLLSESRTSKFDLTLFATDCGDEIWLEMEYSTDLFDRPRIERMLGHYRTLLESATVRPELKVREMPLLTEAERLQLLDTKAQTLDFPAQSTIHQLFEIQAKRKPAAIAVKSGSKELTYRELDEQSDILAAHLQALGAGADGVVAVCLERSAEVAVALLGVLKSGAAYLPLDQSLPSDRLAFMLEDARPKVLITQTTFLNKLPAYRGTRLCIDQVPRAASTAVPQRVDSCDRAYILYTSGSTGRPKGVEVGHRALVNFLTSMGGTPGLDEHDILLSVTTLSFDIFGLELWLPLTRGAEVVIASPETAMDGVQLGNLIRDCDATIIQATPSTFRLLVESGWQGNQKLKILCGGEAWSKELAERLLPKCKSLWNMYGPTETTIWSAVRQIKAGEEVTIGPPIANTQFYIVNSDLQLQPLGLPGELLIGGEGLANGYLNRSDLTSEKFIPDVFRNELSKRLYRTGDLVQGLSDGTFRFISRLDQQVKLRGFRIELGEIESLLLSHPEVREAAVTLRGGENSELAAYVVTSQTSAVTRAELRNFLKQRLPDYMIPSTFTYLPSLPLTANRKINRALLPEPSPELSQTQSAVTEPRDGLERDLIALWEQILRVYPVRPTDNFFDLGGHSFAAVRLVSQIEKLTGTNLPLATLFQAPTVESLARILRRAEAPSWSSLVRIHDRGSKPPLFLVHGAEGNVLLYRQLAERLGSERPVYGLQSKGLNGERINDMSISEMASNYIEEMLAVEQDGPYFIGGYCMGGIIAFEMAKQLQSMKKRVGMVVLLETYNIKAKNIATYYRRGPLHFVQNLFFHGANAATLPGEERRKFFRQKFNVARTRFNVRIDAIRSKDQEQRKGNGYSHLLVKQINEKAAHSYVPENYHGRVALFRPKAFFKGFSSPTFEWDVVVGDSLEVHEMPVYPRGMLLEPFCRSLADEVQQALAAAEEASISPDD